MTDLEGTAALARFVVRRDRVRIAVWILAIVLLVTTTAASTKALFPTQADLDQAAASSDTPAAIAFNGPAQALDTMGGQVAFQVGAFGLTMVALMTLLLVGRWTRGEEESGRLELVRSMAVGRRAPLAAALLVVAGVNLVIAAIVAASLAGMGLPAAGSVAFGLSFLLLGLVFAGVTLVTAQVSEVGRVASGLAGAVLGASFALRAIGDIGSGAISWLSPIGWSQKLRPYAGERWWAAAVPLLATGLLALLGAGLAARRDFGSGLVAQRPGPPTAGPRLGRPLGLALRLQRGLVFWWSVALALTGVAYGSIADSVEDFVEDNEALADLIAQSGAGTITDAYLATSTMILALIASGFAVMSALRPRTEEGAERAESLLATGLSRHRWLGSQALVAAAGSVVVLAAGGLGTGATYALVAGDAGEVPRMLGASLVYAPALWVVAASTFALYGVASRWAVAGWGVMAACFVIGMFRELLDLPLWLADLSPFDRTPRLPAGDLELVTVAGITVVAAVLTAVGFAGFRRRDLQV